MIENKELGVKIAEDTDEAFWTEQKGKVEEAIKADARNAKIHQVMLKLCEEQLK